MPMDIEEALRELDLKFTSGNSIDVERAVITRAEYEAVLQALGMKKGEVPIAK